jgi:hypothetical protein
LDEFRLIVTGSREWSDPLSLRAALAALLDTVPRSVTLVVVHGGHENPDYSTNADRIAQEWALELEADGLPVRQDPRPADWEGPCRSDAPDGGPGCKPGHRVMRRGASVCPAAGPYRNHEMCAAGADWGLAALKVGTRSTGTRDCLRRMIMHGIPFEMVIEGSARGLPEDLVSRAVRR